MHDLPVGSRVYDLLTGPIKAVVLHAHGEVALGRARVVWGTCVKGKRDGVRAHAVNEDQARAGGR